MPRDAVYQTANVERNGGHKWVRARTFGRGTVRRRTVRCKKKKLVSASLG